MASDVRAPKLDAGLAWLNTDRPLHFEGELKGQVVILDFWTYCCINCMHILPDLAWLEEKYKNDPVTFIGVHSAKFTNEASRETIRSAILRYEIKHPVVVDDNMKIWRSYAVRSWPTLVVVDSNGYVAGVAAGEGNRDEIDHAIAQALTQGQANNTLADGPLTLKLEANVPATSGLAFPGKVLADDEKGRLYIADSNHNRIIIAELPDANGKSKVIKTIGCGRVGADDGPAETATFNHPQGLAVAHDNLYVADTENHLIRAIDLSSYDVHTVVGTGEMSNDRAGGAMGPQQGLNSPWDLVLEGSTLYVAMAGTHQIWRVDLPVGFARALAGTGRENIVDGPAETAALSQPSGICSLGGTLYFADSEVSAIRGIDLAAEQVFTLIGEGLFSFGDVDGIFPKAKLQHPLGVEAWNTSLLVADTYNHKIKVVDPGSRSVRTLYGTGSPGASDDNDKPAFFEPGGLSVAGDHLYIADTNNHRIVRINLETHQWCEVMLDGMNAPASEEDDSSTGAQQDIQTIEAEAVSIASGKDIELTLDITLPENAHLNPEAPWSVSVIAGENTIAQHTGKSDALPLKITIPVSSIVAGCTWQVSASFAYCTDGDHNVCIPEQLSWNVSVNTGGKATNIILKTNTE